MIMAQISRAYKFEVPVLIRVFCRNYNHQRRAYTYYEILHISRNATQKDIRDAYIKLSKKLHPDCSNKGNHNDFVKINEAYTILSNPQSKHNYDIDLNSNNVHSSNFYQHTGCNDRCKHWEAYDYDIYYSRDKQRVPKEVKQKAIKFCVSSIIIGIIIELILIKSWSDFNRNVSLKRSAKIQLEYERIQNESKNKTLEETLQRIEEWLKKLNLPTDDK